MRTYTATTLDKIVHVANAADPGSPHQDDMGSIWDKALPKTSIVS